LVKPIELLFHCIDEIGFPGEESRERGSEYHFIYLLPDFPCCNREDLHEEAMMAIPFSFHCRVKEVEVMVLVDAQEMPALLTEWTLEKEMISVFFYIQIAKHTAIVIPICQRLGN
jgi:hypothetical protein